MEQYLVYGSLTFVGGIALSVSIRFIPLSVMRIIPSLFFESWAVCAMMKTTYQGQGSYPALTILYTFRLSRLLIVSSCI